MTYGWRDSADSPLGGTELCDQCGFDARAVGEEPRELNEALVQLERLLDHPDRSRRPEPETFSADEYVAHCVDVCRDLLGMITDVTQIEQPQRIADLSSARVGAAHVLAALSVDQLNLVHTGTYSHDVSVGWIARHLLHDLHHHVLDIRRGYAKLALAELPGGWNAGGSSVNMMTHVRGYGIRRTRPDDSMAMVPLFDALGYPTDATTIQQRLCRLHSDADYESWVACTDGEIVGFAAAHLVRPVEDDAPVGQLIALVTAPQHEGRGVGQALTEHFESWARSSGAQRLVVTSGSRRTETHTFYKGRGYSQSGLRFGKSLAIGR